MCLHAIQTVDGRQLRGMSCCNVRSEIMYVLATVFEINCNRIGGLAPAFCVSLADSPDLEDLTILVFDGEPLGFCLSSKFSVRVLTDEIYA